MYKKLWNYFRINKIRATVFRGKDGKIVLEDRKKLLVWKKFIQDFYKIENKVQRYKTPEVENENHDLSKILT